MLVEKTGLSLSDAREYSPAGDASMEGAEFSVYETRPTVKLKISAPDCPPVEVEALVDTAYSDFVSMPIDQAFPFGFPLFGEVPLTTADGETQPSLACCGVVTFAGRTLGVPVLLKAPGTAVSVGMQFLRVFDVRLLVHGSEVAVMSDVQFDKIWGDCDAHHVSEKLDDFHE